MHSVIKIEHNSWKDSNHEEESFNQKLKIFQFINKIFLMIYRYIEKLLQFVVSDKEF